MTEAIVIGASLLESFLPETAQKIAAQLGTELRAFDATEEFGLYESGNKVTDAPQILFARLDWKEVAPKVEEIQATQKAEYEAEQARIAAVYAKNGKGAEAGNVNANAFPSANAGAFAGEAGGAAGAADAGVAAGAKSTEEILAEAETRFIDLEAKEEIEYGDFARMQFQVGVILKCEEVPKSKKLLCSQVKVGSKVLQIVSGIKKAYSPEQMVGKRVMVLVNLKPAKLAGLLSEGMLLCAEDENGELSLMVPEKDMPSGAEIC